MNENSSSENGAQAPSESQIRERAYSLYEQSGRVPGRDWENWLKAESELMAKCRETPPVPSQWPWHYQALVQIRDALRAERAEHTAAIRTPFSQSEGGADIGDIANDVCAHNTLVAEISLEDAELAEIDAALERIRNGTYGICEVTGEPISASRLRAVPWTRRELAAQTKGS